MKGDPVAPSPEGSGEGVVPADGSALERDGSEFRERRSPYRARGRGMGASFPEAGTCAPLAGQNLNMD